MARGSPFATFLIIGPTCFFLGLLFASFPYDYYVLWAAPPAASAADPNALSKDYYFTQLETHLRILHASPALINRLLHIVMGTGIAGLLVKLYKPSEANLLFDGASLVLYMCAVIVYLTNVVKGLRVVTKGTYVDEDEGLGGPEVNGGVPIGREDSLKVLAASNTILALLLVGVLILQTGQWYAQKKEAAEIEQMNKAAREKRAQKEAGLEERVGNGQKTAGTPAKEGKKKR